MKKDKDDKYRWHALRSKKDIPEEAVPVLCEYTDSNNYIDYYVRRIRESDVNERIYDPDFCTYYKITAWKYIKPRVKRRKKSEKENGE